MYGVGGNNRWLVTARTLAVKTPFHSAHVSGSGDSSTFHNGRNVSCDRLPSDGWAAHSTFAGHIRGEDMYGKSLPSSGLAIAGVTTGRLLAMAGRRETRELLTGDVRQALPRGTVPEGT